MTSKKGVSNIIFPGRWLAAARVWLGWTQGEAAEHAGTTQQVVSRAEARANCRPTQAIIKLRAAYAAAGVEILADGTIRPAAGD
ncbi:helix-turn-helix domain-containing protein [Adonisia turfae]